MTVGNGSPSYESNGINNNPTIRYEKSNSDQHTVTFGASVGQPADVFIVGQLVTNSGSSDGSLFGDPSETMYVRSGDSDAWELYAGGSLLSGSSPDTNPHVYTTRLDGANSVFYIDGSSDLSGNAGANGLNGLVIANRSGDDQQGDLRTGQILVYNPDAPGYNRSDVRNYLVDGWGPF